MNNTCSNISPNIHQRDTITSLYPISKRVSKNNKTMNKTISRIIFAILSLSWMVLSAWLFNWKLALIIFIALAANNFENKYLKKP